MLSQRPTRTALLGLAALALGACSQIAKTKEAITQAPLVCPRVSILSEGSELVRFAVGPGQSAENILHREIFIGFTGACEIMTNEAGNEELVVEISPQIASERGPGNFDGAARFEYFVALTDSAKRLITKQRFEASVQYGGEARRQLWTEPMPAVVTIPLRPGESSEKWLIFIGLQLTRSELEYMRPSE